MRKARRILQQRGKLNTEVTHYKGKYYVLYICKNNNPVPLFFSKDIGEIINYCETF